MDSIKDRLNKELQSIAFSEQRKEEVIQNVTSPRKKTRNARVWTARFVLAAVFVLSFGFVLLQRQEGAPETTQAARESGESLLNLFTYDSVKIGLMLLAFAVFYGIMKRHLRKQKREFPDCANCGVGWSRSDTMKLVGKGEKRACPHCGTKNFQTRKSRVKTSVFQLPIPFMIVIANVLNYSILGVVLYLVLVFLLIMALMPYYVKLQLDDPNQEPIDPLW